MKTSLLLRKHSMVVGFRFNLEFSRVDKWHKFHNVNVAHPVSVTDLGFSMASLVIGGKHIYCYSHLNLEQDARSHFLKSQIRHQGEPRVSPKRTVYLATKMRWECPAKNDDPISKFTIFLSLTGLLKFYNAYLIWRFIFAVTMEWQRSELWHKR